MSSTENNSFQFWKNYYLATRRATNPAAFALAIIDFYFDGKEPTFSDEMDTFLWGMIRPSIDRSRRASNAGGGAPIGNRNGPNGRRGNQSENQSENQTNRNRIRNRNKEIELEKENRSILVADAAAPAPKEIVYPTLEELKKYFKEKGFSSDPEGMFFYYGENEWHQNNGLPIKNWRMAAARWEHRKKNNNNSPTQPDRIKIPAAGKDNYPNSF